MLTNHSMHFHTQTHKQADPAVLGPLLSDAQRFDCLEKGDIGRVQAALKLTKNQVGWWVGGAYALVLFSHQPNPPIHT